MEVTLKEQSFRGPAWGQLVASLMCHCRQGGGISAYRWLDKRDRKLLSSPKSLTVVSR